MANTITTSGPVITISSIDEDYDLGDYLPIQSIRFNPGGADTLIITNGGVGEATLFKVTAASSSDDQIQYFDGQLLRPYLDYSEGSFSAGAEVTIILQRGRS